VQVQASNAAGEKQGYSELEEWLVQYDMIYS